MLHNIKIITTQNTEIATQGKFINIVLAAGEIEAIIRLSNDTTFNTKLISGMSFPVPQGFKSVSFGSDVAQQMKVWLGDLPLTYAPIDSRSVGSSAIESTDGQVFSDIAELIPAVAGRNKITITPEKDIFIGGVGLNALNGIKVAAGDTFTMQTQGAVYAYETTQAHYPIFQPIISQNHLDNATEIEDVTSGNLEARHLSMSADGKTMLIADNNINYFQKISYPELVYLGDVGLSGNNFTDNQVEDGGKRYITTATHNVDVIDLTTLSVQTHNISNANSNFEMIDAYNGNMIVATAYKPNPHIYIKSNDADLADDFVKCTAQPVVSTAGTNFTCGVGISPSGVLAICYSTQLFVSDDNGESWTELAVPAGPVSSALGFAIDKKTGAFFIMSKTGSHLYKSLDDGVTWENIEISVTQPQTMIVRNGTIAISGSYRTWIVDAEQFLIIGYHAHDEQTSIRGLNISSIGVVMKTKKTGLSYDNIFIYHGDETKVGGIPVAIMSELN